MMISNCTNNKNLFIKTSLKIILLTTFIFTLFPSSSMTNAQSVNYSFRKINITAHRGDCTKAPENTLCSIQAAIKIRSDYAEIDVQQSKDGQVMLTHDSNFKRTAKLDKNVWDLTHNELKKLDVGKHFSTKFKGERIPTLEEAIRVAKNRIKLNIEIKTNGHEKNLVEAVVKIIEENHFQNQCVITSFDNNALKQVRKLNKNIKIGYLIYKEKRDFSKMDVDFYSIDSSRATADFIQKSHKLNRQVFVWTVNKPERISQLIDLGADNIITDRPLLAKKEIASKYRMYKLKKRLSNIYNSFLGH